MPRTITEDERRVAIEAIRELVRRAEQTTVETCAGERAVLVVDLRDVLADAIASLELGQ